LVAGVVQNLADRLAPLLSELRRPLQRERLSVVLADDRLEVLVVRHEHQRLRLLAWLEAPLPPGISRDGGPELGDALGDLLGDLLLQGDLPLVPGGAVVVSAAQAPVRTLLLPPDLQAGTDAEDLRDWLRSHQDRLPPLQDQEIALEPLPLVDGWALACLPRPALDRWLLMFAAAGLELHGLEPELFACRRALVGPLDPPRGGLLELRPQTGSGRLQLWNDGAPLLDSVVDGRDAQELASWLRSLAEALQRRDGGWATAVLWWLVHDAEGVTVLPLAPAGWSLRPADPLAHPAVVVAAGFEAPTPDRLVRPLGLSLRGLMP
jgi:hypothetical protein